MLRKLYIQNIILIEDVHIPFENGLNVLSGETGSGKSAIMNSLNLISGEKADSSVIRRGCEKGVVEASFDIALYPDLLNILLESGIDHDPGEDLIIRRELSATGKSRAFINHQMAQVSLLRRIGSYLIHSVGQHANQRLFSLDYHRQIVDLYGDLSHLLSNFQISYEQENRIRKELDDLIHSEAQRIRDLDMFQREFTELEEADLKEGEEEELFAEYTLLANGEEISSKIQEINQILSGERQAVITNLNRQKASLEQLIRFDPALSETSKAFQAAILEIEEVAHILRQYYSRLSHDPERLAMINERLSLINRLKRKYGQSIDDILNYQLEIKNKLETLQNADIQIETLKVNLSTQESQTNVLSQELSKKRLKTATSLEKALTLQLHSLNMQKAELAITISHQKRTSQGDDRVEFFLTPNRGEHQIALKDGASGGEMSRVLLALQTLLAGKEATPILIFDEVDGNIGGETASIVGDKLKQISEKHQVLCITHFPQVASQACHHFQISKEERNDRTVTIVRRLDKDTRVEELARMVGNKVTK